MTMPDASSASLIPDHDDSVENDKDFAKLKGEEEEENTPVVPMSQDSVEENDKDFVKLKGEEEEEEEEEEEDNTPVVPMSQYSGEEDNSSVPKSKDSDSDLEEDPDVSKPQFTEEEARIAFDRWRQLLQVEYADQSEYDMRFKFFKGSLRRTVHYCWRGHALNMISLADRSRQERRASGDYCDITIGEINEIYEEEFEVENDKDFATPPKKLKGEEEEENTPVVPMSQDSVEENDKDFAKLKGEEEEDHTPVVPMSQDSGEEDNSSVPKSQDSDSDLEEDPDVSKPQFTEEEARIAFERWRQLLQVEYADQSEYDMRFKFFKGSLRRTVHYCWRGHALNMISLADRSRQERRASGDYCDITIGEINEIYEEEFKV